MADTATETATPAAQFDPEMVRQVTKQPLVGNHRDFHWITEKVSGIVERRRRAGGGRRLSRRSC